jgi:hypothetical protein
MNRENLLTKSTCIYIYIYICVCVCIRICSMWGVCGCVSVWMDVRVYFYGYFSLFSIQVLASIRLILSFTAKSPSIKH